MGQSCSTVFDNSSLEFLTTQEAPYPQITQDQLKLFKTSNNTKPLKPLKTPRWKKRNLSINLDIIERDFYSTESTNSFKESTQRYASPISLENTSAVQEEETLPSIQDDEPVANPVRTSTVGVKNEMMLRNSICESTV
jgi:hypothetical protein